MDKLLFYTLNNRGLPQGPNYERTSMLGKLTMFNNGGPVSGRPYLSVMPGMTGGIDLQAGTDFNIKDRVFGDINISNPIVAPNMQSGEYSFAPLNPNVSGRVAIPLQDMDIVGSFDTDFNQARLNASASMGFPKGDISGNIGTDLKNVYGGVDINYRPIDPLSLNYSLNADPSGVYHDIGASYNVNDNVNLYGNVSLTPQEPPAYRVGLRANFEHGGTHVDPPFKTPLSKDEEFVFQNWRKSLPENLQTDNDLYDLRGAWKAGLSPERIQNEWHMLGVNPETGMYLKSPNHPTYLKSIEGDIRAGFTPYVDAKTGRVYSNKLVYTDGGDVIDPGDGWQYLKEGNDYLTRKKGSAEWIKTTGKAKKAIQDKIYKETDSIKSDEIVSAPNNKQTDFSIDYDTLPAIKQIEASTSRVERPPMPNIVNPNVNQKQFVDKAEEFHKQGKIVDREPVSFMRNLLPYPCYDYTCMEFVKDVDKATGRHSIPSTINTNKDFYKAADKLGYKRLHPDSTAQPGDIISFYRPELKTEEFPEGTPYHAGVMINDSTYIDTGGGEKYLPIGYPVRKGPLEKNPYYTYRWSPKEPIMGAISGLIQKTDGGDVVDVGDGYEYLKEGDNYLTRKKGNTDWITAKGDARKAIQTRIFPELLGNPLPQEQQISIQNINRPENFIQPNVNKETIAIQQKLFDAGYDLGTTGPLGNGVDGDLGPKTQAAIDAYNKGINAQDFKSQDLKMQNEIINQEYKEKPQTANYVTNIQNYLIGKGYEIDKSGVMDTKTKNALKDYETSGKFATLPIFPSNPERREEICRTSGEGYGCSKQATLKSMNLFSDMPNSDKKYLWANDAWFNKDAVIKNGGTLLYETEARGKNIPDLPKEVYGLLQVGDYVHLDRRDTDSSRRYAKKTEDKAGNKWENEKIEHMGLIIGKDTDGTPLIWHASETGKAYIKRVDEPITLDDHKGLGAYRIASIARSGKMTDEYQKAVAQNPYFSEDWKSPYEKPGEVVEDIVKPFDSENMLTPLEGTNDYEKARINEINNHVETFMKAGYPQDDVNKAAQIVIGGVLEREAKRGSSATLGGSEGIPIPGTSIRIPLTGTVENPVRAGSNYGKKYEGQTALEFKEGLADIAKAVGLKRSEVSRGIYQMKPEMNFGGLEKELNEIGLSKDQIFDSEENQTKAATLLMLKRYKALKADPDYYRETDEVKIKGEDGQEWFYPASYILAGGWSAGPNWWKKDSYRKILTSDKGRDYSNLAMRNMANVIQTQKGNNYGKQAEEQIYNRKQEKAAKYLKEKTINRMAAEGYDKDKITDATIKEYEQQKYNEAVAAQEQAVKDFAYTIDTPPAESTDTNIFMDPNIIIPSDLYSDFVYGAYDLPEVTVTAKRIKNR